MLLYVHVYKKAWNGASVCAKGNPNTPLNFKLITQTFQLMPTFLLCVHIKLCVLIQLEQHIYSILFYWMHCHFFCDVRTNVDLINFQQLHVNHVVCNGWFRTFVSMVICINTLLQSNYEVFVVFHQIFFLLYVLIKCRRV